MYKAAVRLLRSPRQFFGVVICVVGVVLLVASFAGALNGSPPAQTVAPPKAASATESAQNTADPPPAQTTAPATPQQNAQTTPNNPQAQSANTTNTAPEPKPQPTAITVSLEINNVDKGNITVPVGSNHCDVLTKALGTGVIQSLDMRWNEPLKTYGVYRINGVGDDKTIGWVYEVNDKSPPYGCSRVKPNPGEHIHWKYLS